MQLIKLTTRQILSRHYELLSGLYPTWLFRLPSF